MGLAYRSFYSRGGADSSHPVAKRTLTWIMNIIQEFKPKYLALTFDPDRGEIYRKQLSQEYKSNRKDRPIEIVEGLEKVKEFCEMFNIKVLQYKKQESDDIIASFVEKFKDVSKIVVLTIDGDLTQLHSKNVRIAKPTKTSMKILKSWSQVQENFKKIVVDSPDKIRDHLALCSDKSDGIEGVPRVGSKRALKLVEKYGTIKDMFASNDDLPYNIRDYEDLIYKNRNLIKLYTKIEIPELKEFEYGKFDYEKAFSWLQQNGLAEKLFNNVIDLDF